MIARKPLPNRRMHVTDDLVVWNGHSLIVSIGLRADSTAGDVFADTPAGGDLQAVLADACVLISIALQHGVPPDALAKSLGRVPVLGTHDDAPASPVGAVVETLLRLPEICAEIAKGAQNEAR